MKLTIKVTRNEIKKGQCSQPSSCAIALAVRDVFPKARVLEAGIKPFYYGHRLAGTIIPLPSEAVKFIQDFDNAETESDRKLLSEFQFDIEVPESYLEEMNIDEIKSLLVNHPTLAISEA